MNSHASRLCLVRHGETDWNVQRRLQGQIDIPLNAAGRRQTAATAAGVAGKDFAAVYSSDLSRAWQTARPIADALGLSVKTAVGLRERHYGRMQGLTGEEARQRFPDLHAAYAPRRLDYDLDGGETLAGFALRVDRTLRQLAEAHRGQALLLVSHGGVLDVANRLATGRPLAAPRDFPVPNAGLNWLEYRDSAWRLLGWGEQAHLAVALDEVTQ